MIKDIYTIIDPKVDDGSFKVFFLEIPPCRRTIFFNGASYFLSFPKIRFSLRVAFDGQYEIVFLDMVRMCFVSNKGNFLAPPLPNLYDFNLCFGDYDNDPQTIDDAVKDIINLFFDTEFNTDGADILDRYYPNCTYEVEENGKNYPKIEPDNVHKFFADWRDKTKKNPRWIPQEEFFATLTNKDKEKLDVPQA